MRKSSLLAIPVFGIVAALIFYDDRWPVPRWLLIAIAVVLVVATIAAIIYGAILETRAREAASRELGLAFAANPRDDLFQAFAITTRAGQAAQFEAVAAGADPRVQAVLKARFESAQSQSALSRTELARLPLFRGPARGTTADISSGRIGDLDAVVFDYSYTTGVTNDSLNTTSQTVAAFRLPGRNIPSFELTPEGLLQRAASVFGYQDIDFENAPEFSKRFVLRGEDEAATRAFFTPSILAALVSLTNVKYTVEAVGSSVAVYRPKVVVPGKRLSGFLADAAAIAAAIRTG